MNKTKALFLDRDGVVNVDEGYVYQPERFQFIDGIFALGRAAQDAGYIIIIVTNQAGVARGFYEEADVDRIHEWMRERFDEQGVRVQAVYYCPFHVDGVIERYRGQSDRRKPNPGMLIEAATDHGVDLASSVLIGDRGSDIEAGRRAGVGTLIMFDPSASPELTEADSGFVSGSLQAIANWFMAERSSSS